MAGLINLPGYNPGNALNFSGLNAGIDTIRENALMQEQMGIKREQLGMQKEKFGMEKQQFADQRQQQTIQRFAAQAQGVDQMQDPAQRKAAWDQILASHPKANELPPTYWDPVNGPKMLIREAEGFMGRGEQAKIGLIEAQTAKARADAANGGEQPMSVKEWRYYSSLPDEQKQQYLTMKRAEKYLNTGTEFTRPNPIAPGGAPISSIPINTAARAAQQTQGKGLGQAIVDLPKVQQAGSTTLRYIDDVLKDPNLPSVTGAEGYLPTVRSSSRDTEARISQLGGRAFLSAFESLKGGGQITEIEGKKATDALARLTDLKQSDSGYKRALEDFRGEVMDLVRLAERKAQGSGPYVPPQGVPTDAVPRQFTDRLPQAGQAPQRLRFNPATGELE